MKKKPSRKKKVQGFFYYKKKLYIFACLVVIGLSALLFLPNRTNNTNRCANTISCINDLSGRYDDDNTGTFMGKEVLGPAIAGEPNLSSQLAKTTNLVENNVLGEATDSKRIYVDLSKQMLYAFDGNTLQFEFPVSTGKYYKTPTGEFRIWIKLRYTRMQGGNKANGTYYNLPNVPYTMFFYNEKVPMWRGYAIHGAYWHDNFGHPMSHGCVNMREADVARLYEWANPVSNGHTTKATSDNQGTLVTIYGVTPSE